MTPHICRPPLLTRGDTTGTAAEDAASPYTSQGHPTGHKDNEAPPQGPQLLPPVVTAWGAGKATPGPGVAEDGGRLNGAEQQHLREPGEMQEAALLHNWRDPEGGLAGDSVPHPASPKEQQGGGRKEVQSWRISQLLGKSRDWRRGKTGLEGRVLKGS